MTFLKYFFVIAVFTLCTMNKMTVNSFPITKQEFVLEGGLSLTNEDYFSTNDALNYLTSYGYLKPLTSEDDLRESILNGITKFQKMYGLQVTGYLDSKTDQLMKVPRCGVPDTEDDLYRLKLLNAPAFPNQTENDFRSEVQIDEEDLQEKIRQKRFLLMGRWPSSSITYGFRSYAEGIEPAEQQNIIAEALNTWSEGTLITFEQHWEERVDIAISFERGDHGDGHPFDGTGKTLAHAFFPGLHEMNGDVHFDKDENWIAASSSSTDEGTSLLNVAIHEFGHALGLGHSTNPHSVMHPFYQKRNVKRSLSEDDRMALNFLYGENNKNERITEEDELMVVADPREATADGNIAKSECDLTFDAVANIRKELFFFKGDRFWRFTARGEKFFNESISQFWFNFTASKVDAVYARNEKTIIFSGRKRDQYWVYINHFMDKNKPHLINDFGLPLKGGIDAAFVWLSVNDKTYFFKGNKYWKYDEIRKRLYAGYPKNITVLGLPSNIDGVFTNPNDKEVYFLKGKLCWKLNKDKLKVFEPQRIGVKFFGCASEVRQAHDENLEKVTNSIVKTLKDDSSHYSKSSEKDKQHQEDDRRGFATRITSSLTVVFLTFLLIIFIVLTN